MKKLVILFVAVLALSASYAQAQEDKMLFNHMSAGISLGLDGVGVELAFPASHLLQVRGGYSICPIPYKKDVTLGTLQVNGKNQNLSNIPVSARFWKGGLGNLMVDIYLNETGSFHFVAGAFAGSGKLVNGRVDLRQKISPDDYRTGITYNDVSCSTDAEGYAYVDATVLKVLPYLGVGFGRALDMNKQVSFNFELGAAYSGGIKTVTYDYSNPSRVTSNVVTSSDLVNSAGKQVDNGLMDKLARFPILPMLKFQVFMRLF